MHCEPRLSRSKTSFEALYEVEWLDPRWYR